MAVFKCTAKMIKDGVSPEDGFNKLHAMANEQLYILKESNSTKSLKNYQIAPIQKLKKTELSTLKEALDYNTKN